MLTRPAFLGLPGYIWLMAAAALLMLSGLLAQEVPALRAAVARGRARRRRERRRERRMWDSLIGLSDRQWLAELARMRVERSGQLGPAQARDWDPPGAELAAWLDSDKLWPGDSA